MRLSPDRERKLTRFANALVDQQQARVVVPPQQPASGFWFGGGNMTAGPDGLYLVGRYRNAGDSRTGLQAGERGLELAVFRSTDGGQSFTKTLSLPKAALDVGERKVLSIEGTALHWTDAGVELFVSSEKTGIGYPDGLTDYLKPGAGVWTIERLEAASVEQLANATRETVLESSDPEFLHFKDPAVYERTNGELLMLFCTHPYSWSSSNTAYAARRAGAASFETPTLDCFPRGTTWDVAITRGTCLLDVPRVGDFADLAVTLMFYDGGESLRDLDEHAQAVRRPRGYSCEELGGVAYVVNGDLDNVNRLSRHLPTFISPRGTGCSRYVDVLAIDDGFLATWQQSQDDGSQPLVMNRLSMADALAFLS